MTPTDTAHIHSLAHHTRLTPYGLGVAVSHPDVVSLSVVGGLGGVSRALTTIRRCPAVHSKLLFGLKTNIFDRKSAVK